jgi:hypothetical protein
MNTCGGFSYQSKTRHLGRTGPGNQKALKTIEGNIKSIASLA